MAFPQFNWREYIVRLTFCTVSILFCNYNCFAEASQVSHSFTLQVKDKNGQDYTIGAPGDDVVVVVFFTTWCQCCPDVLRSLDLLIKTLENMKITNVKIIALNIGNEPLPALESYYSSNGIKDLRVYCSIPLASVDKDVSGVPAFRVYSKTGKQIWTHVGAVQCNSDEFINLIEGLSKRGDK